MAVFMQPIFTQTISSSVSGVSFNNIPQGFTDLKLVVSARGTSSAATQEMYTIFNDSGTGYSQTRLYGTGSLSGSQFLAGYGGYVLQPIPAATATANTFSNSEYYIANYSRALMKQITADFTAENNIVATELGLYSENFQSSAPITKISFAAGGGLIAANSTFTLYGISNIFDTQIPIAPTIGTITDEAGFVSVAFTPASNDGADLYAVTTTPSTSTTYGATTPISTPATIGTSYTYKVASVNSLGSGLSANSDPFTTSNSFASIATATVTGSPSQLRFTNIPQNYTHLQVRIWGRGAATGNENTAFLQFNTDGSANYGYYQYIYGNGTSVSASNGTSVLIPVGSFPGTSATSNFQGAVICEILDYTNLNKLKMVRSIGGNETGTTGSSVMHGGYWASYAPITTIDAGISFVSPYTLAVGSVVELYGIG